MRFSSLTERIAGEGARAWEIHIRAVTRVRGGEDVILLSIGDPDFDTPPSIVDRCVESLRAGNTHYSAVSGDSALRAAIADVVSRPTHALKPARDGAGRLHQDHEIDGTHVDAELERAGGN